MRRLLVLLAPLALLAAGCGGGGSKQSHSVIDVSKAFYDAGVPFSAIVTGNPYVTGQTPYLPLALNSSDLRFDVLAELSGSTVNAHTGEVVYVFDTNEHANQAVAAVPLKKWGEGPSAITRVQLGNVIVIGSGFTGAQKAKLDQAIAALK